MIALVDLNEKVGYMPEVGVMDVFNVKCQNDNAKKPLVYVYMCKDTSMCVGNMYSNH